MKIRNHLSFTKLAVAAAMVFSFSSCEKDNGNEAVLDTKISFVNTVEGSTAQDIYINDLKVNTSAVAYGDAATNIATSSGNKTLSFRNAGSTTVTASANVTADRNTSHTAFLVKQVDGNLAVSAYANDNTAAANGKAKVRFVNVAPMLSNAVNVITSTGTNLISALAFRAASAYQTIDANTSLNVNMSGSLEVTTIAGSQLQAGKIYTIWFDSSTATKVKYHIVVQN